MYAWLFEFYWGFTVSKELAAEKRKIWFVLLFWLIRVSTEFEWKPSGVWAVCGKVVPGLLWINDPILDFHLQFDFVAGLAWAAMGLAWIALWMVKTGFCWQPNSKFARKKIGFWIIRNYLGHGICRGAYLYMYHY